MEKIEVTAQTSEELMIKTRDKLNELIDKGKYLHSMNTFYSLADEAYYAVFYTD